MAAARGEIAHWTDFDHVLVNRDFDRTVATVRAILQRGAGAARAAALACRVRRGAAARRRLTAR